MAFINIPGQLQSKSYLSKLIEEDRVPHALLFSGPEGNGKLAYALLFSIGLLCEQKEGIDFCGECNQCTKSTKFIHPDLHFTFPVCSIDGKKREETTSTDFLQSWRKFLEINPFGGMTQWVKYLGYENKNFNINVTECNQIIKSLSLRRYEGRYKIQIIWGAEFLAKEGNRLLKLIEEPTPNTLIILVTDRQDLLLNTILSRCQVFRAPPFTDEEVDSFLEVEVGSQQKRNELVRLAGGNLRLANELIGNADEGWNDSLLQIFRYCFMGKVSEMIAQADMLASLPKKDMESFCLYTLHFLKEYMRVVHLQSTESVRLSDAEKATTLKMTKVINIAMANQVAQLMERNIKNLHRNANKKILWTNTMFEIEGIFKSEKIAV